MDRDVQKHTGKYRMYTIERTRIYRMYRNIQVHRGIYGMNRNIKEYIG